MIMRNPYRRGYTSKHSHKWWYGIYWGRVIFFLYVFAFAYAVWGKDFKQVTEGMMAIDSGTCIVNGQAYMCLKATRDEKTYLIFYDDKGRPIAIRREDGTLVWQTEPEGV